MERRQKLSNVLIGLGQDLTANKEKIARAEKSLNLIQTNMQKKKVEIPENSPHMAQLDYDIEVDKNKTLVTSLINLGNELPELGPLIEEVLKDNNIEIESKAPSSVGVLSSQGSVKSGGSAISRSSRGSRHWLFVEFHNYVSKY